MHPLDRKAHCAQPTAYAPLSLLPTSAGQPKLAGTATSHDGPVAPPVAKLQGLIPLPQTVTSISGPLISSQQQRRGAKEANQQDGLGHATLARWGSNVRAELTSKRNARHGGLDFIVSIREGQHGLAQTILLSSAGRAADPGFQHAQRIYGEVATRNHGKPHSAIAVYCEVTKAGIIRDIQLRRRMAQVDGQRELKPLALQPKPLVLQPAKTRTSTISALWR